MNKSDPLRRIAGETDPVGPDTTAAVSLMPSGITGSPARGQAVFLLGLGTLGTRRRLARTELNPGMGETLDISAPTVAAFNVGQPLRDAVNPDGP